MANKLGGGLGLNGPAIKIFFLQLPLFRIFVIKISYS